MEIVFKKAESEDISKLVEFMEEYYEYDHLMFDWRVADTALGELLGDESLGSAWLIQCAGKEVGYIVVSFICALSFTVVRLLSMRCISEKDIAHMDTFMR